MDNQEISSALPRFAAYAVLAASAPELHPACVRSGEAHDHFSDGAASSAYL